jgi:hypothetical protein
LPFALLSKATFVLLTLLAGADVNVKGPTGQNKATCFDERNQQELSCQCNFFWLEVGANPNIDDGVIMAMSFSAMLFFKVYNILELWISGCWLVN